MKISRYSMWAAAGLTIVLASAASAADTTISGTVDFQGTVVFPDPIPGITAADMTASSGPGIDATGNGEHCAIVTNGSAPVGAGGAYPDSGTLSVGISISHGGNQPPSGTCLVQLKATGNDGGSVSARGTVTVEVTIADIQGGGPVVADPIVVRQSKTQAGLSKDCLKWVKKETKLKGKCNFTLWKLGGTDGSLKCKNAGLEPLDCDPANYVDDAVELSFGQMNQQDPDPTAALAIDYKALADQSKCQRFLGKAAANFLAKRNQLVQKHCIDVLGDDPACRATATNDAKVKLTLIDKCVGDQQTDMDSALTLPDVGEPCRSECIAAGVLDRKCMKTCFEFEITTLSDGVIGDVPECGNGVLQAGEACDDGNLTNGDCCDSTCHQEPAGSQTCGVGICQVMTAECSAGAPVVCTPGAPGTETSPTECSDGLDNDCDSLVDAMDPDCP